MKYFFRCWLWGLIQYSENSTVKSPVISTSSALDFKSVGGSKKKINHKFSVLQSIPETNSLLALKSFVFP